MNTPQEVHRWSALYPVVYDQRHYDPNIDAARAGDTAALRLVTQWKNPGRGNPPTAMRLAPSMETAFQRFLAGLNRYLAPNGRQALRNDFPKSSPVYAIFWHHVLFQTPIFDIHTNRAFHYFTQRNILPGKNAAVPRGGHWKLYDRYCTWFQASLARLQEQAPAITERQFDRALMQWGKAHQSPPVVK